MPININCQCFDRKTLGCLHPMAPKKWFGHASCLEVGPPTDRRIAGSRCRVKMPYEHPMTVFGRTPMPATEPSKKE